MVTPKVIYYTPEQTCHCIGCREKYKDWYTQERLDCIKLVIDEYPKDPTDDINEVWVFPPGCFGEGGGTTRASIRFVHKYESGGFEAARVIDMIYLDVFKPISFTTNSGSAEPLDARWTIEMDQEIDDYVSLDVYPKHIQLWLWIQRLWS